ncbi:MAG: hypothetical protein WKG06_17945 [Segetibacter sp.]
MALPDLNIFCLVGKTSLSLQLGHRISGTGFTSFIENIKCDFYNWSVSFIREPVMKDELRLASLEDIAAFKLDTIIRRKEKKTFGILTLFSMHFL